MVPPLATRSTEVQLLIDDLGSSVKSSSKARFERIRQNALAAVRSTAHSRTNQFAVRDQLAGLQEKAEILHRSDLATALSNAVNRANAIDNKWMPECLSLLLQVSHRPIDNTNLEDLESIRLSDPEKPLTWEDILRDDPYDSDDSIWKDVDFAAESSEDDDEISLIRSDSRSSFSPSIYEQPQDPLQDACVDPDPAVLDAVEEWRAELESSTGASGAESSLHVTESLLVREILFMLHGTPTDIFPSNGDQWAPRLELSIEGASSEVLYSVLNQCASLGTQLSRLRLWSSAHTLEPIKQTFLSNLSQALRRFDSRVCALEQRTLDQTGEPETLLSLVPEVRDAFQELAAYAKILKQYGQGLSAFDCLESLYKEICSQQSMGNSASFNNLVHPFEQCFQTFLKPIANWLYCGDLSEGRLSFLDRIDKPPKNSTNFWSEQFRVIYDPQGIPLAPTFFQPFVRKVIGIGKAIAFLRLIGQSLPPSENQGKLSLLADWPANELILTSFEERLNETLQEWIAASQQRLSGTLSHAIRSTEKLDDVLEALERIYFSRNGACFNQVAIRVFERLNQTGRPLENQHVLTSIYQDAYSTCDMTSTAKISVRLNKPQTQQSVNADIMLKLEPIEVFYALSWPVANILKPESMAGYRCIHRLLLQLRIAQHGLNRNHDFDRAAGIADCSRPQKLFLRLRHQLRWFTNVLSSYLLSTVLPNTHQKLRHAADFRGDLDDLIDSHSKVIDSTLKHCLLYWTDSASLKALKSMLRLAIMFAASSSPESVPRPTSSTEDREGQESKTRDDPSTTSGSFTEARLEELLATYRQLLGFIYSGVRDASRAEGDRFLQVLAQDLSTSDPWLED